MVQRHNDREPVEIHAPIDDDKHDLRHDRAIRHEHDRDYEDSVIAHREHSHTLHLWRGEDGDRGWGWRSR